MRENIFFKKNWFFESFIPGEPKTTIWGFVVERKIYSGKSKYQEIEIFKAKEFGRVLVLDKLIQLSTKHEFVYHEMLVHPALIYHQNPKIILIIGGGDGGVLREVVKHPVEQIYLVDIDKEVINVSKKYLPSVSNGAFDDKRLKIFNEDALKFIKKYNNFFDVIIEDLTDWAGPSIKLWQAGFYRDLSLALKKEGIFAAQTGHFREKFAKETREKIRKIFRFFKILKSFVDYFPFDEYTFSFASKMIDFNKFTFKGIEKKYKKLNIKTKYYSPEIHFSSAVLPRYLKMLK